MKRIAWFGFLILLSLSSRPAMTQESKIMQDIRLIDLHHLAFLNAVETLVQFLIAQIGKVEAGFLFRGIKLLAEGLCDEENHVLGSGISIARMIAGNICN